MRTALATLALIAVALPSAAGPLDATGTPAAGSGMPTTTDIYNRLQSGTAIAVPGTFREPAAGPLAGTGKTLADIASQLPVPDNANGAAAGDVANGKTFWGLRTDGTWGPRTGSQSAPANGANVVGSNGVLTFPIPDGIYAGSKTATATDSNLAAGNIKSGVTIFGIAGASTVVDTSETVAPATAADIRSGRKAFVNGVLVVGTAANTTPDAFDITDMVGQGLNTPVTTNAVTVAGVDVTVAALTTVGTLVKNGTDTGSSSAPVANGDTVAVRLTTSSSPLTAITGIVGIGTRMDNFSVTTLPFALPDGYVSQGGLIWTPNISTVPGGFADWNTAATYCATQTINGKTGWRLPTAPELVSLRNSGALATQTLWLRGGLTWSSTLQAPGYHQIVVLDSGFVDGQSDSSPFWVTCVYPI